MSDKLGPYCLGCGEFMIRTRVGFLLEINDGYDVARGDAYKCPVCGWEIIINFGKPYPNFSRSSYIW